MEVINISKANLKKLGYRDLEHWLEKENHIYIGRNMSFYVKGAKKSKWFNPFSEKKYGRDKCIDLYKEYLLNNSLCSVDNVFKNTLRELISYSLILL